MKKYREITQVFVKAQLTWRFNIAMSVVLSVAKILFALIVWGAIYEGQGEVAGLTLSSMLTYYVVSSFFAQLESSGDTAWEVRNSIRQGTFSGRMVMPVSIGGYYTARAIGRILVQAIFVLLSSALWVVVFGIPLSFTSDPLMILAGIGMQILGLLFMMQLDLLLGLLTLKVQDIFTLLMIKGNLLAFATGAIIPLVLLPDGVLAVMRALPFYYITYLPSMLIIGENAGEILPGFLVLGGWLIVAAAAVPLLYTRLRRRYDGVGI